MNRSPASAVADYVLAASALEAALQGQPEETVIFRLADFWRTLGEPEPESLARDTLAAARSLSARAVVEELRQHARNRGFRAREITEALRYAAR